MQKALSVILIAFIVVAVVFNYAVALRSIKPTYANFRQHCETREALQESVDVMRQQIAEVNRNIERFQDSGYFVERLAREHQRVTANEVIFIFE